jgi:hypothetical protein
MIDLLMLAVDAYGGLVRWNRFKTLNGRMSTNTSMRMGLKSKRFLHHFW